MDPPGSAKPDVVDYHEDEDDDAGETPCGSAPQKKELEAAKKGGQATGRRTCHKCNTAPSVFVWRTEHICWECFHKIFDKRFKTNFVKGRTNKRDHVHLILAYSGGPSSSALLHGVAQCTMGRGTRALYRVDVVHIDQSRVVGISESDRAEQQARLRHIVEGYGFSLEIVPLEAVLSNDVPHDAAAAAAGLVEEGNKAEADALQRLFDQTKTLTSKEDLLVYFRNRLLASLAAQRRASWVCVGDSATRIAVDMIADTCKGRAFGLPDRLSFLDTRHPNLLWVRPMKEFLAQEITLYNHFARLPSVFIPELDTKASKLVSINHLAESFLAGLQADFPQTIHTLLRSGDKLSLPPPRPSDTRHYCPLCHCALSPADIKVAASQAAAPIVGRQEGSCSREGDDDERSCAKDGASSGDACCGGGGGCGSRSGEGAGEARAEVVRHSACYGCRKLLAESEPALLPPFVGQASTALSRSLRLREEISSFLLDDDDDGEGEEKAGSLEPV